MWVAGVTVDAVSSIVASIFAWTRGLSHRAKLDGELEAKITP